MSGTATTKMLSMYEQNRRPSRFLSTLFRSPRENFHNTEAVEIDIQRDDEEVAVAVTSLKAGYNFNKRELYTNKRFIPPIFKEGININNQDMINRQAGVDPFQDPNYVAHALKIFASGMALVEDKINRAVELQASQVLQTGTATLKDENGNSVYTIDYSPKATHFPTASPVWNGVSPTIKADLSNLMGVIRNDGLADPTMSIWGIRAYNDAMADTSFKELFNKESATQASIVRLGRPPVPGAQYRGTVDIDHYPLDIWTYEGKYVDVETGVKTTYIDQDKVVIYAPDIRLDMTWGNSPMILPPERRVVPFIPPRISRPGMGGVDMITNIWTTDDGEHLFGGITARPLAIPTAIDQFGCITTR